MQPARLWPIRTNEISSYEPFKKFRLINVRHSWMTWRSSGKMNDGFESSRLFGEIPPLQIGNIWLDGVQWPETITILLPQIFCSTPNDSKARDEDLLDKSIHSFLSPRRIQQVSCLGSQAGPTRLFIGQAGHAICVLPENLGDYVRQHGSLLTESSLPNIYAFTRMVSPIPQIPSCSVETPFSAGEQVDKAAGSLISSTPRNCGATTARLPTPDKVRPTNIAALNSPL